MADHTQNSLGAAIKALTEVVGPAIAPGNPLANEQLRLVVDYIRFVQQRLDWYADRHRLEFHEYGRLAKALLPLSTSASETVRQDLAESVAAAERLTPGASISEFRGATAALTGAIRRLVREAAGFEHDARGKIERVVLDGSIPLIDFERAWYVPLGFDPAPAEAGKVEQHVNSLGLRTA